MSRDHRTVYDSSDSSDDSGPQLDTFSSMTQAGAAFLTAVGDYQDSTAHAWGTLVASAGDAVVIAEKREVLKQLRLTYARLRRNQHQAEDQLAVIKRHVDRARWLYLGERLESGSVAAFWVGYRWLLQQAAPEVRFWLFGHNVTEAERAASNWASPHSHFSPAVDMGSGREHVYDSAEWEAKRHATHEVESAPEDIRNVVGLAAWCAGRLLMPRTGSPAMRLFSDAIGRLCEAAAQREAQIRTWLKEAEQGVYSTFDPLKIDNVPHNTAIAAHE